MLSLAHAPLLDPKRSCLPEPLDGGMQDLQPELRPIKDSHTVQAVLGGLLSAGKVQRRASRAGQLQGDLQQVE